LRVPPNLFASLAFWRNITRLQADWRRNIYVV